MDKPDIPFLSAAELGQLIRGKEVSPVEAVEAYLERIQQVEDRVKAFVTVTGDLALQQAEEADRRTLIRRLSFDLTGLPPTWEQVQAFVAALDQLPATDDLEGSPAGDVVGEREAEIEVVVSLLVIHRPEHEGT